MPWIKHTGNRCPVPHNTVVFIRTTLGQEWCCGLAGEFNWSQAMDPDGRVAEYKIATMDDVTRNPGVTGSAFVPPDPVGDAPAEARQASGAAAVGDLASNAVGTAARFNAGKVPLHLIPAGILADLQKHIAVYGPPPGRSVNWNSVLCHLGTFQMLQSTGGIARRHLLQAMALMNVVPGLTAECARVFEYGMRKYAAWNWAKGQAWSVPLGSAMRHIVFGVQTGERDDPESGLAHRGHVACNIVMLLWFLDHYTQGDDRRRMPEPVRSNAAGVRPC